MKMKKYEAKTEQEAIEMVKNELGLDALILNIKKVQPKGFFAFFRKSYVEVTAAYEDNFSQKRKSTFEAVPDKNEDEQKSSNNNLDKNNVAHTGKKNRNRNKNKNKNTDMSSNKKEYTGLREKQDFKTLEERENENLKNIIEGINEKAEIQKKKIEEKRNAEEQKKTINSLEKKLGDTEELLQELMYKLSVSEHHYGEVRKYDNSMLQFFYNMLISQEVTVELAEILLQDIENIEDLDNLDINLIVKIVYNRIIKILGKPDVLKIDKENRFAKNVVFIGPTGVGKTTTIAKLSSSFIFGEGLNVGFITADTYRIAAVEQLKTYADILNSEVGIVYNNEDVMAQIDMLKIVNDVIFIDTAGRSHRNIENLEELKEFLNMVADPEIYLVLSITTKYDDLVDIIEAYSKITNFKIIFTKLDETNCLGSILNVCHKTGKRISYATNGQNVPDDIEIIKPEKIAKALLGSR